MENTYSLAAQTKQRPVTSLSDCKRSVQLRLVADDKRDLDQMIQMEQQKGWLLASRSYSLDEGHGATLIRQGLAKAA